MVNICRQKCGLGFPTQQNSGRHVRVKKLSDGTKHVGNNPKVNSAGNARFLRFMELFGT